MARKPQFSANELEVLIDMVEQHKTVLFSKLKNTVTNAKKKDTWNAITEQVNSVGTGYRRTTDDVRAKWRDYSSVLKRRAAGLRREQQRTGGGSTSESLLTPQEERVLAVLGAEALEGVPGGIDLCDLNTAHRSECQAI